MSFAESIARITRAQAETETLAAEARKFVSEAPKIGVEPKLLRVSRHVTPVAVVIGAGMRDMQLRSAGSPQDLGH